MRANLKRIQPLVHRDLTETKLSRADPVGFAEFETMTMTTVRTSGAMPFLAANRDVDFYDIFKARQTVLETRAALTAAYIPPPSPGTPVIMAVDPDEEGELDEDDPDFPPPPVPVAGPHPPPPPPLSPGFFRELTATVSYVTRGDLARKEEERTFKIVFDYIRSVLTLPQITQVNSIINRVVPGTAKAIQPRLAFVTVME